jgi:type IV pilus assembly protein PilB
MTAPRPAAAPKMKLEELLLRHGSITQDQLAKAQAEVKKWGGDLGRTLVELGFISEQLLMRALAHQLKIRVLDPATERIPEGVATALGVQLCERYGVIAVGGDPAKKVVEVATSEPTNQVDLKAIATTTGFKIQPAAATAESIQRAIRKYYYGEDTRPAASAQSRAPARASAPASHGDSPAGTGSPAATGQKAPAFDPTLMTQITAIWERIGELESPARLSEQIGQAIMSDASFSGIVARVEQMEQLFTSHLKAVKAIGDLLVEQGVVTRDQLNAKIQKG